jgi:hypothetical protein
MGQPYHAPGASDKARLDTRESPAVSWSRMRN